MSDVTVSVTTDDRARLVMAALAAGNWPEREQAQETHAVHPHSKQTRQVTSEHHDHVAVQSLNKMLNDGVPLHVLFATVLRCRWPGLEPMEPMPAALTDSRWTESLAAFYQAAGLADFWASHAAPWLEAQGDLSAIFHKSQLLSLLSQLSDKPLSRDVIVVPSLVYPMLKPVMAETHEALFLILPPAKAWGESPPWPFGEDPGWVISQTCWSLTAYFMANTLSQLDATAQALLQHAAVTLCLEEDFDKAEAMAYLVRSRKEHNLPRLPLVVEMLKDYLLEPGGRSLIDLGI